MSKRQQVIVLSSLILGIVALTAYGIFTTARIRTLERRLSNAEERLRKVEADRRLRFDPLSAYHAEASQLTNGGFLFDGLRPDDPVLPGGHPLGTRNSPIEKRN